MPAAAERSRSCCWRAPRVGDGRADGGSLITGQCVGHDLHLDVVHADTDVGEQEIERMGAFGLLPYLDVLFGKVQHQLRGGPKESGERHLP